MAEFETKVLDENRVRVGPRTFGAVDVLEYAKLLIETEGWNQTSAASGRKESSKQQGWTLHDNIGEACTRLTKKEPSGYGGKEGGYRDASTGQQQTLRPQTQAAVDRELTTMKDAGEWTPPPSDKSSGRFDYDFNDDPATTKEAVIGVLERAREAELQRAAD